MPAHSKHPSVRARRNKTTTRATLKPVDNPEIPDLPPGPDWYPQVRDWWTRAWSSPMVPEWTDSDVDTMYLAAKLMQEFWSAETSANVCRALAGEIRQLLAQCGLTPMSRRSLQWEIERGEEAQAKTKARRESTGTAKKSTPAASKRPDPRRARLAAVQ
ncbi:hypothetical protein [Mycobacterium intracellulare]|uniref:phage terminase small subunit n=1 Tax=Mycobacterium intracellulare TaxID=1767 RepID=UPI00109E5868|nr:hypothetical protein [Mycobacterium intracellulare]